MTIAELHRQPLEALPRDVFSLPAESFVDAWAKALDLTEGELSQDDRSSLANAIREGTNRLRVVDALKARRPVPVALGNRSALQALQREPDQFAILENFTRFAPDDDAAFLRYSFSRICGREPDSAERLGLEFDLRRGVATRAKVVKKIVAIARRNGQAAFWDTLLPRDEDDLPESIDPSDARIMPAGLLVDMEGLATAVFVREVERVGWMIGADFLCQPLRVTDKGWNVQPGWLLVGPKRSFAEGIWLLDLDLVQPANARLDVEIVANSGLDFLQQLTIAGPFSGALCVNIRPEHRFIELRIRIHERAPEDAWLRPRNISLRQSS
ncbi:hypothetical protein J2046_001726 [Rhizobium petrolearium]|uniref:hypothetical protein n=1 Tax=Neorhizobium petrolearium TaxID=515361 RepID=UPI001AE6F0C1|nr:hypothetical protein [Neorhizobium petrolearium]MBP1843470.1 hypothetical protein [Neorhizobium petrolearium]